LAGFEQCPGYIPLNWRRLPSLFPVASPFHLQAVPQSCSSLDPVHPALAVSFNFNPYTREKSIFLFLLLLPALAWAQAAIDAKEIVGKINRGEAVSYRNATISGTLDLTQLDNRKRREEPGKWDDSKTYVSTVQAPVSFTNCTFAGDVLAYYHLEAEEEAHTADFDGNVVFENCTFKGKSAFKYSRFARGASFAGSRFGEEALFKYSHFNEGPDFSKAQFEAPADFKYAHFQEAVNFSDARFGSGAVFKYTQFPARSSFRNVVFARHADFKYAKFSEPVDLSGVDFRGGEDFKYTRVGGKSMPSYLLTNKK
jgi:uncharacterized protein YjbI with pentapeptide repeats